MAERDGSTYVGIFDSSFLGLAVSLNGNNSATNDHDVKTTKQDCTVPGSEPVIKKCWVFAFFFCWQNLHWILAKADEIRRKAFEPFRVKGSR